MEKIQRKFHIMKISVLLRRCCWREGLIFQVSLRRLQIFLELSRFCQVEMCLLHRILNSNHYLVDKENILFSFWKKYSKMKIFSVIEVNGFDCCTAYMSEIIPISYMNWSRNSGMAQLFKRFMEKYLQLKKVIVKER